MAAPPKSILVLKLVIFIVVHNGGKSAGLKQFRHFHVHER